MSMQVFFPSLETAIMVSCVSISFLSRVGVTIFLCVKLCAIFLSLVAVSCGVCLFGALIGCVGRIG